MIKKGSNTMKNNNFKVALKVKFRLNWFFLEHVTLEDILRIFILIDRPSPRKLASGWRKQVPAQKYVKALIYPVRIYDYRQQAYLH